ncbi:hypothetical protein ILUMI_18824 [Ignelater luminosus]|uniref:PiggyBac transposable element-derived protein domain-containing protein n=1 Tax=Ignelater luminosus TaxID=2038154 RepID=A0A8K0CHA2_IGNLU|nr:hypothetical protein ILUMI_18824 [Ignelater luminosus]
MYWAANTRVEKVADVMLRNRWEDLKRNLHFNNNSNMPNQNNASHDKLYKIRPIVDTLQTKFSKLPKEQMLCVDKQIVPFKGKSNLKQYNAKKPHNFAKVGIGALGTIRTNRFRGLTFSSDLTMRNRGRECFEEKKTNITGIELRALKWFDNRGVMLASTFESSYQLSKIKRLDRKTQSSVEIDCPKMIQTYNQFMGGIDLLDGLIFYYRIKIQSKKYYLRFFFHLCALYLAGCYTETIVKHTEYHKMTKLIHYNLELT